MKVKTFSNTRYDLGILEYMTLDESDRKLTVRYQRFTLQAGLNITDGADAIIITILIFF